MYFIFSIPLSDLLSSEIKQERNELKVLIDMKAAKCKITIQLIDIYCQATGTGTWDLGLGTWDLGPGTWDLGLGTWDLGPGNRIENRE